MDLDDILGELCDLETELSDTLAKRPSPHSSPLRGSNGHPPGNTQLANALSELSGLGNAQYHQHQQSSNTGSPAHVTPASVRHLQGVMDGSSRSHKRVLSMDSGAFTSYPGHHLPHDGVHLKTHSPSMVDSISGYDTTSMDYMEMTGAYSVGGHSGASGLDTDSAFSDTMSLPSSGSHISVTTTSSGSSNGSANMHSPTPVRETNLSG